MSTWAEWRLAVSYSTWAMAMVIPRSRSSGALSIEANERNWALPCRARYLVIAAVSVVLPWSMWPMVPTLTCGLVRSNFFLAIVLPTSSPCSRGAAAGGGGSPQSDPHSRRRLIYSQRSSPPAQPTHAVTSRERGSVAWAGTDAFFRCGADAGIRTQDLRFTKPLLCQLSYVGQSGWPGLALAADRPDRGGAG